MKILRSERGFPQLVHKLYVEEVGADDRLVSQSSAIGEYEDSMDKPGSSFLWVGSNHHLNREEVGEFVTYLQRWLETGSLEGDERC